MPHNRYYIDALFEKNGTVHLSNSEWNHLVRVSRSRKGDTVELINGRGQLALATVQELRKNDAALVLDEIIKEIPPLPQLILAQAIPRMNHLEWIIEKGTELNVTSFWLFPGSLSEKGSLSDTQMARLKHLCISAMKQCGRLDLPEIVLKPPLAKWPPTKGTLLFGDVAGNAPYLWDAPLSNPPSPMIIFIGPEKGFDPKEHHHLSKVFKANGVRLHPNILRAETAPLVALALIQRFLIS